MSHTTHSLLKDIDGKIWHYSTREKIDERPRKVDVEWVRLHFGERAMIALQERSKINITHH